MTFKKALQALWSDDRGQSTTEYILILSVVVMIAMKFRGEFGKKITDIVTKLTGDIDKQVSDNSQ